MDNRKTRLHTKRTDVKRDLKEISTKLRRTQYIHLGLLALGFTYWIIMLLLANQPLDCKSSHESIKKTLRRDKEQADKRLKFHPSVDYEHALRIEETYECFLISKGCNYTTNKVIDGLECTHNASAQAQDMNWDNKTCQSTCVPEPFELINDLSDIWSQTENDKRPVAMNWYAIIHFWDFIWLLVACYIQLRLRNLRDSQFSSMVIDDKDIASSSIHILTVFMTLVFYLVDLVMSVLWISLHNADEAAKDHASYWTIYERNSTLAMLHAIHVFILLPILILSFIIRESFQKYELIQFLTEIQ